MTEQVPEVCRLRQTSGRDINTFFTPMFNRFCEAGMDLMVCASALLVTVQVIKAFMLKSAVDRMVG